MSVSPVSRGDHAQQPSARWCFVCGVENPAGLRIRFFNDGPRRVFARIVLGDEYQSYPGMAHGGIVSTILDETMGRAVLSPGENDADEPRFMFTAKMELRFRQPVALHTEFIARGWVEKDRGRTVLASGEIVLPDGVIAVEASATLVDIPQTQLDQMLESNVGWQIYPE